MAADSRFLALLRGINVGGHNVIAKDDLRACFESLDPSNVRTYIQSGNILFRIDGATPHDLTETIARALSERFAYDAVLRAAPNAWGADAQQKHNALFTLPGITPQRVVAQLPPPKPGIESVTLGPGVIFWSILKDHQAQTTYAKLPAARVYRRLTIRNHNTVCKLRDLFEAI